MKEKNRVLWERLTEEANFAWKWSFNQCGSMVTWAARQRAEIRDYLWESKEVSEAILDLKEIMT